MTVKYYAILTNQGAARLANATMLGSKLNLTQMAVGDANGVLPTPDPAQTKLINQKRIAPLNLLSVDPNNQSQIIAEQIIPENEGGFWIREIGLYDDEGVLIAVANCPETYKPQLQEGSGRTQTIRMILAVSNTEAITLKIDPSVVLATRKYVDDKISEHEQSRRHPDASLTAKGFTQLSSATNSDSETLAATPKAVKTAYDLANGKYTAQDATTARKGLVQLSSATNSTSETLAATPKAVKSAYDNAEKRLQKDQNGADIPDKRLFLRNIGATNSTTMSFIGGAGWFKLATVTMPQASSVVYISLIGGSGYNVNSPMQAGISELVLRAGNGNPKGLTGALWRRTSVGFTNFAWVNTSGDTYDVYVEIGGYATGVNIQWDYTSNASVTIHTSPTYTANKPTGLTDGAVYVIYSSHIKPTTADLGLSDSNGYVGRLVNTRIFTSSGTYTPTPGTKRIRVTITGGGGGGGGCQATSNNETFFGAGGGAGGTAIVTLILTKDSYPVTIGAGGGGGVGATNGLKGGDSSFGTVIAPGGEGGGKVGVTNTNGGNGGVPSTGGINITGGNGGDGQSGNISVSGEGGTSHWGGGGRAGAGGGVSGKAYGSGGGGAYDAGYSGASMTGGKGAAGICIIEEFA
ncbi:phage tail fiber repeat family protein [Escherichia coli 178200]|uniref:phage tail protein n=1 Tax=Escherichia coli TaxID=562 RepID=UPI0002CB8F6A|nr:phage tail protein [Escherichia coli]EMW79099.1 phage tail fiber repeat family protein [Escherichia coli 180600]EMZ88250.1 phage tail fiber repeat family protein [Escherichia coli 199900.1]ENE63217.1 phage tail fiber repeat family protein [Escherichia coli P0304777.12]ENE77627.1 phage tail fiber repeat family protein [Escherichia coli P0304777.14]ENE87952.1 phage tail fiber repeat family protein [Escherichia coli P0304777.3]